MPIQFGGLASGLDTNNIIDGLMAIERQPLTRLRNKQTSADKAVDTVSDFVKKLTALKTAADALATPSGFASFAVTSADSAVVAQSSGAATQGTYALRVNALAREQRTFSATQTSGTSALSQSGSLSIQAGSATAVSITVDSSDSLASLASKINSSGARVSASVLFDGTDYRLQVRGLDTGASNAVVFTETGITLGLSTPANTVQAARDSEILMDTLTIRRPTNQLTDVIPGVTLALTKETTSNVEIRVSSDPDALERKIGGLVTAYNDVIRAAQTASGYGTQKASTPELQSDMSIRTTLGQLSAVVFSTVAGTSGKFTTLGSVGIGTGSNGQLSLNATKLKSALSEDPTAVAKLFVVDAASSMTGAMGSIKDTVDRTSGATDSLLQTRIESLRTLSRRYRNDSDDLEIRVSRTEQRLRAQFTALEVRMSAYQSQLSSLGALPTNQNSNNG